VGFLTSAAALPRCGNVETIDAVKKLFLRRAPAGFEVAAGSVIGWHYFFDWTP